MYCFYYHNCINTVKYFKYTFILIQLSFLYCKQFSLSSSFSLSPFLAYVEQTENAATGAASIIVNDTGKIKSVRVLSPAASPEF